MQSLKALLRRRAMHIDGVWKMAIVPDDAQEFVFQVLTPPASSHAHRAQVVRIHVGVTDDAHTWDCRKLLVGEFEKAALKIPGNAVVARRTIQPVPQEFLMQAGDRKSTRLNSSHVS